MHNAALPCRPEYLPRGWSASIGSSRHCGYHHSTGPTRVASCNVRDSRGALLSPAGCIHDGVGGDGGAVAEQCGGSEVVDSEVCKCR